MQNVSHDRRHLAFLELLSLLLSQLIDERLKCATIHALHLNEHKVARVVNLNAKLDHEFDMFTIFGVDKNGFTLTYLSKFDDVRMLQLLQYD